MDTNGNNSHSHDLTRTTGKEDKKSSEEDVHSSVFINHAEMAWDKSRKVWIGDKSQKSQRRPRELVMSWTATYEELLSSNEPFHTRIPLAISMSSRKLAILVDILCGIFFSQEMVDFLVDIWNEEGLYD